MRARSVVESFAARSGETAEESEDGEQVKDRQRWAVNPSKRRSCCSLHQDSHHQGIAEVMYHQAPPSLRLHLAPNEVSWSISVSRSKASRDSCSSCSMSYVRPALAHPFGCMP